MRRRGFLAALCAPAVAKLLPSLVQPTERIEPKTPPTSEPGIVIELPHAIFNTNNEWEVEEFAKALEEISSRRVVLVDRTGQRFIPME